MMENRTPEEKESDVTEKRARRSFLLAARINERVYFVLYMLYGYKEPNQEGGTNNDDQAISRPCRRAALSGREVGSGTGRRADADLYEGCLTGVDSVQDRRP
jgi:hypothetical protein